MPTQPYTISHTGTVVGADSIERAANQVNPQRETEVVSFECPKNYDAINYVGSRDPTRFKPRTMESFTVTDDDASGALEEGERTLDLTAEIQPINGEPDLTEQAYPTVRVVNATQGAEIDVAGLTVDYAAGTVVVPEADVADGDTVKAYPIIVEGTLKFYGTNALGQTEGPVYPWDFPIRRFADMPQDKRGTEINLQGSLEIETFDVMEVRVDAPHEVVWTDADYPEAYVSEFEQDVTISF